ncbi:MAG: hypothetical protein MJ252_06560, partial [archaeon]|nr:hypothetical protein [archaeon]
MSDDEEKTIREEKLQKIKKQFEKLFAIKGFHLENYFNSNIWFLKENNTFQSIINTPTPMANEPISKRIMDIFCSLNESNQLKNLNINVGRFINEISNKIIEAHTAITISKNNIQQNKTLEKIARLNEILQILNHKIESSNKKTEFSSIFRANIHCLKNFPKGNYKIFLFFNNNFTKEEEREMNATERKNLEDNKTDELSKLYEQKRIHTKKVLEIPSDNEEVTYRTQRGVYKSEGYSNEPNSFPEYKFVSLKREGCKYILDRRYSGCSLSNFKIQMTDGVKTYSTKNEFLFLYVLNCLFEDFLNINRQGITFNCEMKAYEDNIPKEDKDPGIIDLEVILEVDDITRAELLNRIREVFSLTVDTKEDNVNFIKEL